MIERDLFKQSWGELQKAQMLLLVAYFKGYS
jgi:hypothetical protein